MKRINLLLIVCSTLFSIGAHADILPTQVATCTPCHGQTGNSTVPEWPKLAGQNVNYLRTQLHAFKKGSKGGRVNASMNPMVASLSDEDIAQLANYYATQTLETGTTPPQWFEKGQQLFRAGNQDERLAACIGCHGPQGKGNNLANIPAVGGQHAAYTVLQLKAYKDKSRLSTVNGMMNDIAARMSENDMTAVAHYLAGLH